MKKIYKYEVPLSGVEVIDFPVSGLVKHVAMQGDKLCFWAEFDTLDNERLPAPFQVFGTGHNIPSDAMYMGTTQQPPFVWHLYRIG